MEYQQLAEKIQLKKSLYNYGIKSFLISLQHYEEQGDYEVCSLMKETIEEHNQKSNDNLQTHL